MTPEKKFFAKLYPADGNMARTWFIKYFVKNYDSGKLQPKKYKGHLNLIADKDERLREAKRLLRAIEFDEELPNVKGARRIPAPEAPRNFADTIELATKALENIKYRIDAITHKGYKSRIMTLRNWMDKTGRKAFPIGKFNVPVAKEFLRWMKETGYKNKTHNNYRASLSRLWDELKTEGIISANPWKDCVTLPNMSTPFRAMTENIEGLIVRELPKFDNQLWLVAQFIYYDFVRVCECGRLKLWMINWTNQTLTIPADVSRKGKKERVVVIPDILFKQLLEMDYDEANPEHYIFSYNGVPGVRQLGYNNLSIRFRAFREKFNVPVAYKLYGMKHTGNSKLARHGVNARIQQLHNGHSSLEYTQHYVSSLGVTDTEFLKSEFPKLGEQ